MEVTSGRERAQHTIRQSLSLGGGSGKGIHSVAGTVVLLLLQNLSPPCRRPAAAACGLLLRALLDTPVEDIIVLVPLPDEEVPEQFAQVRVVWLVVEAQCAGVVEEDPELVRESPAQEVRGGRHLLLHNPIVLLLLRRRFEALPRKSAAEEVHEDISEGLEVVPARLLDTKMCVDGGVASGPRQVLVLSVGDVEVGLGVPEFLRKPKVDDVDLVAALANAHEEIVRLDVAVNEVAGMDIFDAGDLRRGTEWN